MNTQNPQNFPIWAFPPSIGNAIEEVQRNTQAPLPLVAASALGAISLVCQDLIDVLKPNGAKGPVSLSQITIAASGERKTTVDKMFLLPVREFEADHDEKYRGQQKQFKARWQAWEVERKVILGMIAKKAKNGENYDGLENRLIQHSSTEPQPPRRVKLIYDDATPEAIKRGLYENFRSAGLMADEAGGVLNGRATAELGMFNSAWDGATLSSDRITTESFSVKDGRLTVSLMLQEKQVAKFMSHRGDEARDMGFLARFLIAHPFSTQGTRFIEDVSPQWLHLPVFQARMRELLEKSVSDCGSTSLERQVQNFSIDAKARWREAFNALEQKVVPDGYFFDIKDFVAKLADNLARVAALFHYFSGEQGEISLDTVNRAVMICEWYLQEFKRLFGMQQQISVEQADANLLESWFFHHVQRGGPVPVKKNAIRQYGPPVLRNKQRLDAALAVLMSRGLIGVTLMGNTKYVTLNSAHFGLMSLNHPQIYQGRRW